MKLNMSLFKKLLAANIFYALPVIAMVYMIADSQNTNINFGKQELKGNIYQRPLEDLLKDLGALRLEMVSASLAEKNVDADIAAIQKVQGLVGEDLQFTKEGLAKRGRSAIFIDDFEARWNGFREQQGRWSAQERDAKIAAFIADTRTMITHAGDTSNLILDPDLDSYYLMDIALCALPQLQDRIQETLAFVQKLKATRSWSEDDRRSLAVFAALLRQSDLNRITGDADTVFQEDANFYGSSPTLKPNLEPAVKQLAESMGTLIKGLERMSLASSVDENYAQVMQAGQTAFGHSFSTWTVAVNELDGLISNRVGILTFDKYRGLAIAIAALLVAFGILFGVAQSFNKNMQQILARLQASMGQTQDASRKLVAMSDELAAATTEQAAALQETSSAIHEITSMVQATLANTSVAETSANESLETSTRSHAAVDQLVHAINEISQSNDMIISTVEKSDKRMGDITRIISEIETKTKVINDIVFQTKLLSFNASVEAARAGEHGKGFAVVAEEVGNLAAMSGNASKDISEMLGGQIQQVNTISTQTSREVKTLVDTGKDKVNVGIKVAGQFSASVEETLTKIRSLRENVTSIHGAAGEQARGIDEISKAVQRLDALTQRNSAMSSETAEYSKDLLSQSESLESIVQTIESEVLGTNKKAS